MTASTNYSKTYSTAASKQTHTGGQLMLQYRYTIYSCINHHWLFQDAYITEDAADKKAFYLSIDYHTKVIERYEDDNGDAHPFRIFYYHKGKYSHTLYREIH